MVKSNKVIVGYSIVSPLHLINFLTYLQSCEEDFHERYLFIGNYWGDSIIPQRYIDYCKQKNINVILNEDEKKRILNNLLKSERNIFFVCVKSPNLYILKKSFSKNIEKIIIIDEGVSSYAGFIHSLKASFREKGIKGGVKFSIFIFIMNFLKLFNKHKFYKLSAFHKTNINPTYKKYFLEVLNDISMYGTSIKINKKSILFCTQPLIEVGLMDYNKYEKMLNEVKDFCENNKITLLIKKHPVDNIFEYNGYNIVDFDGIVEEFVLTQENIIGTISSCSTSSLLVVAFMNKKSYIFSFESLNTIDSNLKKLFERYCESIENFSNIQ